MSEPAQAPAATGSTLVFRPITIERRAPAIAAAAFAVIAILLGIVAIVRHDGDGNFTVYACVLVFLALVMLYITLAGRRFVTECRPEGIRTTRWGRARQCAWSEVADIKQRTVSGRSSSYTVEVTTKAEGRFVLGVPNASSSYRNPFFEQQLAQITAYWRASS